MTSTVDLVTQSNGDLSEKQKTFQDMTISEKLKHIRAVITVEPLLVAYLLAAVICLPALYTLELEKACRANLKHNETVCEAIRLSKHENYSDVNKEINILLNNIHSWQVPCQNIAPLILVLFIGSYSDRHQIRKPFMILPLLGELLAVVGCIFCVIFMDELSVEIQGFLQTVVPSFLGGNTMLIMAVFSYVADSSTIEMRTLRVAVVQTVLNVVLPIGQFLSGILFLNLGYIGVLLISACFYLFGITYAIFGIKEVRQPKLDGTNNVRNLLSDMFDPTNAIDTIKVLGKTERRKDLAFLWGILIMFFIVTGVSNIDLSTLFLYLQNIFHWTGVEFSYFSTGNTVTHLLGIIIFVPLFTKCFHLSDVTILIFTFLDKIATTLVIGLAKTNFVLYLSCLVSIITNITIIALRSMATKVVSEDDLGKAQSLFGICEALGIAAMTPLFNTISVATIENFPAAFIFCETIAYFICFLMAFFFYFQESSPKEDVKDDLNNVQKIKMEDMQVTHM